MTIEQQYIVDTVCECIAHELNLRDSIDVSSRLADLGFTDETWYATLECLNYEFTAHLTQNTLWRHGTVGSLCAAIEAQL